MKGHDGALADSGLNLYTTGFPIHLGEFVCVVETQGHGWLS
jgi:hypothetical protein